MSDTACTRRRWPGVLAGLVLVIGGCSVSTNEEPVAAGRLFDDLLQPSTTTSSTSAPENVVKDATVFFLATSEGATRLQPVVREVDVDAEIQEILSGQLFGLPPDSTGEERPEERGLDSAIRAPASLVSASRPQAGSNQLIVNVSGLFGLIEGPALRNALAQIVWTATVPPDITSVSFRNDGAAVAALVGNGENVDRPVQRSDYDTLG